MGRKEATARFRELGAALLRCRQEAGVSAAELMHRTGWDRSKISRMESGHQCSGDVDVIHYLGACGQYREKVQEVLALCQAAHNRELYWATGARSLASLIYHESSASTSVVFEPLLVPGLLQTEGYARTRLSRRQPSDDVVELAVRRRLERQRVLNRPRRFRFFVHERALRTEVGGPEIMHDQLLKLTLVAGAPNIDLRVVPEKAGEDGEFGGQFGVLQFDRHDPLVYRDNFVCTLFLEDRAQVTEHRKLLPELESVSLTPERSHELVAGLADVYERRSLCRGRSA